MTSLSLGGPGPGCSAARLRRLQAGELQGAERARLEEHLAGCERCQATRRELEEEQRGAERALPFDAFAAGVAERLARAEGRPVPLRRTLRRVIPLALAASLALGVAIPLVGRLAQPPLGGEGVRAKGGGAALTVFVKEGGAGRALGPAEPVPPGAALRLALAPGARRQVAVVLLDGDGAALLYAGPARPGLLPDAFEWTGAGEGLLVALFADAPLDGPAFAARVARERAALQAPPGAELVTRKLVRKAGGP